MQTYWDIVAVNEDRYWFMNPRGRENMLKGTAVSNATKKLQVRIPFRTE
jgi:hypothetical protein